MKKKPSKKRCEKDIEKRRSGPVPKPQAPGRSRAPFSPRKERFEDTQTTDIPQKATDILQRVTSKGDFRR